MSANAPNPWDALLREAQELRREVALLRRDAGELRIENHHLCDRLETLERISADYATTNAGFSLCLSRAHGAGPQPIPEDLGRFPFTNHHE